MVMSREDGEDLNKKSWRLSQTADHITVFCRIFHMARLTLDNSNATIALARDVNSAELHLYILIYKEK
ncbi:hypothetical protein CFP56_033476 [Quercus suber]|uniref:Uncharacterized protein n=1 Tax=Quercus suber TaxID=58331 RepID=A0AAW0LRE4_QUESU